MHPALKEILARHGKDRSDLIPILQDAQGAIGYLPKEAMADVARHLNVSEASVYGIASFYAQFYFEPQGRHRIRVCRGTACHVRGSAQIRRQMEAKLKVKEGGTTPDLLFTYETVACVGCCALSPVMMVDDKYFGRLTPEQADAVIDDYIRQARAEEPN
ncbi:MAG: NADH-quinone oxidoreductase subunit NuoE, partial [Planctomycetes bacterium]|nr:NADH-quinone oxidoreductase subunit NuoE [Planctomycetota bacterium]